MHLLRTTNTIAFNTIRIAFNFRERAMAACPAELSEDELPCLLEEGKKTWKT